jgi:hypothetical protein
MVRPALVFVLSLALILMAGSAFGDAQTRIIREQEPEGREFEVLDIGPLTVHFHQRAIGYATVQGDYIVYQFDRETDQLIARKSHWRDDLPEELPALTVDIAEAEAMVEGEVQSVYLYYIAPDSPVFPIEPTPVDPCWVVRSVVDGYQQVTVIDAVAGGILGYGVPPPFTAFSLTGPENHTPCSGGWIAWYENARDWFNTMGYSTEAILWPSEAQVQGHVSSNTTAMFYELAHGGYGGFNSGCPDGNNYDPTTPAEIEAWIALYPAFPFTFIGSCAGMCETGDNTLSYEFRKGSTVETVTVGYCHMDQSFCDDCWYNYSISWQDALFGYMNMGWTVKAAFDQALADYPACAAGNCMRFAGDETFAVVPPVLRRLNEPPVAICKNVTVSADAGCHANASVDNGSYDPDGDPMTITQDPAGPYSLGQTAVTLTVADDHGWVAACAGVVTVVDVTPPSATCPSSVTVEGTDVCGTPYDDPALAPFFGGFSATDNCDASPDLADDHPPCFGLGKTTVTFTATDDAGNVSSCEADVTVVDTTPPEICCPPDITVECNGPAGTFADDPQLAGFFAAVSATDIVDPDPEITDDAPDLFPLGPTTVTFTATDYSGNSNSCAALVTVVDRGIDVWMEDLLANPGDNVLVPVYIQDITGWGLMGFDMEICWCDLPAGLLQYEYCLPGEVLTNSGWAAPLCNPCSPNCMSIAGAGAVPLEGEGVLLYLKFHVSTNAKPCMCCDLRFTDIDLYDPEHPLHVCWQDGSICIDWCDVAGCINYWKCCPDGCGGYYYPRPLNGVQVHLWEYCSGANVATAFTGADGCYEFACLDPLAQGCYYGVNPDYCRIPDCINPYDAAMVLKYLACRDDLDDCPFPYIGGMVYPQQVAADVTCSSGITAYDASVILQYFVGLIPAFPCFEPWVFYPLGPCGNEVHACPGRVDWIGVLIGDVNGCMKCDFESSPLGDRVLVSLGPAADLGGRIEVPVMVEGAYDIFSGHFGIVYDPEELSVISAVATGLAGDCMTAHNASGGSLIFAMAAAQAFAGDGDVALLTFAKLSPGADVSSVALSEAMFNDGEPEAEIGESAGVPAESGRTALGRAVPNPFRQGTVISYRLASAGRVSLEIYNVNGQLVRTLVAGAVEAGPHSVLWNGRDDSGETAARGVYFCFMEAEGYRATEKIVFMK